MAQIPPYSADRFASDFGLSVLAAAITAAISGPLVWYFSLRYLQSAYPHHGELASAAIVAGCIDGAFLGLGAFVFTFALRIWRHEREERKRSDLLLRLALEEIHNRDR